MSVATIHTCDNCGNQQEIDNGPPDVAYRTGFIHLSQTWDDDGRERSTCDKHLDICGDCCDLVDAALEKVRIK